MRLAAGFVADAKERFGSATVPGTQTVLLPGDPTGDDRTCRFSPGERGEIDFSWSRVLASSSPSAGEQGGCSWYTQRTAKCVCCKECRVVQCLLQGVPESPLCWCFCSTSRLVFKVKHHQLGKRLVSQCSLSLPLRIIVRRLCFENELSRWSGTLLGRRIVGGFRLGVRHGWGGSGPAG